MLLQEGRAGRFSQPGVQVKPMQNHFRSFTPVAVICHGRLIGPLAVLVLCVSFTGCQTTREKMLAEGYPVAYADGFAAGCSSGRQALGAMDEYRKDVTRYHTQPLYAEAWTDGYRHCQAQLQAPARFDDWERSSLERERDRDWRHHVDQAKAKAFRR